MAFVHVGRRVSGRATRLTRSTAREARPRRRGGDLVRSGAPDMSGISRQSEKPRGIPDTAVHITRCLHHSMGAPGKAGLYVLAAYLPTLTLFRATSREGAFRRVRRPHLQPRGANPRPFNTFSAPRWVSPLL